MEERRELKEGRSETERRRQFILIMKEDSVIDLTADQDSLVSFDSIDVEKMGRSHL